MAKYSFPERVYRGLYCSLDFPDQDPEAKYARWCHLLWFLVPIVGIIGFTLSVEARMKQGAASAEGGER